jgi:oligopeptide transport system substrate-binding protein
MARLLVPIIPLLLLIALSVWSDRPLPKADLTIVERDPVHTLDPAQISWNQDIRVARAIYEGLLRLDVLSPDQRLEPAAAASLPDISEDGLVYTFRLRENAAWSNGDPVRASDFVYSWRRAMLPDTAADYAEMLGAIRGARAWGERRREDLKTFASDTTIPDRPAAARRLLDDALARFDAEVGVKTLDARTLRVELERPLAYFLDLVAFVPFMPLHKPTLRTYERLDPASGRLSWNTDWTKPPALVGNGPYTLTQWRFRRDMRLERNPHYHDPALPRLATLSIVNIADPNAMVTAFRTGAVDWTTDVLVPYRPEMLAEKRSFDADHAEARAALEAKGLRRLDVEAALPPDPRNRIHGMPSFGTYFLSFNCTPTLANGRPNPLADRRVRRALAMAALKREVVDHIRRTGEPVAGSLIPPGSLAGYTPPLGLPFDPAAARAELAAAGHPGGTGLPPLEFVFTRDGGHDLIAATLKRGWESILGVTIELQQVESRVASARLKAQQYMIARSSWFGDYADPTTFLDLNRTTNNNNDRKYASTRHDGYLDKAAEERDPIERMNLLAEAERIAVEEDAAVLPIFHYTQYYLFDPTRLTGLSTHPRQAQHLFLLDLRGRADSSTSTSAVGGVR